MIYNCQKQKQATNKWSIDDGEASSLKWLGVTVIEIKIGYFIT